jgi:hypothetical protein
VFDLVNTRYGIVWQGGGGKLQAFLLSALDWPASRFGYFARESFQDGCMTGSQSRSGRTVEEKRVAIADSRNVSLLNVLSGTPDLNTIDWPC